MTGTQVEGTGGASGAGGVSGAGGGSAGASGGGGGGAGGGNEGGSAGGGTPDAALEPDAPPPDTQPPDLAYPVNDARAASCNNLQVWRPNTMYMEGADVTNLEPRRRFECRPWPYFPWCSLPDYEPGRTKHWIDAWFDRGMCP